MSKPDVVETAASIIDGLREAVEDLTLQFAYPTMIGGVPAYTTGGLSALEGAFHVLGWDDPHPYPKGACVVDGCNEWATCGGPIPAGNGEFGRLCSEHFREGRE